MKYPKFLKDNNTIGVPAPSGGASDEKKINKYKSSEKFFKNNNYNLVLSKNLFKETKGRSSTEKERAKEFNEMLSNKDIDVIICASGGDFLLEMLPYVDFDLIKKNPKYICGFSDPTGLLYPLTTKYDIATIYGSNFSSFGAIPLHKSHYDFLNILRGETLKEESYDKYEKDYTETVTGLEGYNLTEKVIWKTLDNNPVDITGRIIGGCFDIIADLSGTKYDGIDKFNEKYKDDGIIWYFDNCEITMEETIRVLWRMNELGYFKYTKGVIFGRFGVNTTYYDYTTETCLKDSIFKNYDFPIIYDADISHKAPSLTIINGSIVHINCKDGKGTIEFRLE